MVSTGKTWWFLGFGFWMGKYETKDHQLYVFGYETQDHQLYNYNSITNWL